MLFITLVANYAESIGASGQAMALIICQTMNACMMTPAGGASAAILFGNKGMGRFKNLYAVWRSNLVDRFIGLLC